MDDDKMLTLMQHIVSAVHHLAAHTPSGAPSVVTLANAAQAILTELNQPPKPASAAMRHVVAELQKPPPPKVEDDEDEDDPPAKRGPGRPRTVRRNK